MMLNNLLGHCVAPVMAVCVCYSECIDIACDAGSVCLQLQYESVILDYLEQPLSAGKRKN